MADEVQNSRNPSNSGSMAGTLQEVMKKFMQGVNDMLPAVVIAYDRTENRATVRPMIQVLRTDNTVVDRAEVASVPVLNIGGGNAVLSFNILPGDLGWIKANDRDISLFMQGLANSPPNTLRMHDFGDSLFIPDQFRKWTLDPEDTAFAVFQSLDGTQRVSIHDDRVKVSSDFVVEIESGFVTSIVGQLTVSQNITAGGDITAFAFGDGVILGQHTHAQADDTGGDMEAETEAPTQT